MQIHFNKVKIRNFLSIGDAEINLTDRGYVLVTGVNNNAGEASTSNGSGKSSIWEAILWAITGETSRGCKDIVNLYTEGGTCVELQFNVDSSTYVIRRYKEDKEYKTNLKIYINGEDKSGKGIRDSEKILSQYLPELTGSLLGAVVILGQGLPQRFSNNTPSGRKEVLERLSGSDFMIEDLKQRVGERKTNLGVELRKYQDKKLESTTMLNMHTNALQHHQADLVKYEACLDQSAIIEIQKKEGELLSIKKSLEDRRSQKTELEQSLHEYQQCKFQYTREEESHVSEVKKEYDQQISDLDRVINQAEYSLKLKREHLSEMRKVTDVCPTCGQKIVGVILPDTSGLEQEIRDLEERLSFNKGEGDALQQKYAFELKKIRSSYQERNRELIENLNQCNTTLRTLIGEVGELERSKNTVESSLLKLKTERDQGESRVRDLKGFITEDEARIVECNEKITAAQVEIDRLNAHLTVLSKINTILTRDFRGQLLSAIINFISERAKIYAEKVFDNDRLQLQLNGNSLDIVYDSRSYENLSGGERQRVDIILQLAIREMLCKFLGFSSNMLVIDEVFDNLDAVGSQRILNFIATSLPDIESVFIVTHHTSELALPYDSEIVVTKNVKGISEVNDHI